MAPQWLYALTITPLFFVFLATIRRRRSRFVVFFTDVDRILRLGPRRQTRAKAHFAVIALALTVTAAALARPKAQMGTSTRGTTIILLADVSESMIATDVKPNRLKAAVLAMRDFVDALPANDKVGVITLSDQVQIVDEPTTDHAAIVAGLEHLHVEGGTALGDGVKVGVKVILSSLQRSGTTRAAGKYLPAAIVLESDGAQNRGTTTPSAAAEFAKDAGVRIYGVALGSRDGYITEGKGFGRYRLPVPPDPGTVALLARETGGVAYTASKAAALDSIYRGLGTSLARTQTTVEITSWFEGAGAVLFIVGLGLARNRVGALP